MPQRPCPLLRSSALSSPTVRLRGKRDETPGFVNTYHTESHPGRDGASVDHWATCVKERERDSKFGPECVRAEGSHIRAAFLFDSLVHTPGGSAPTEGVTGYI